MSRAILILVLFSTMFAVLEGAADGAGIGMPGDQEGSHEIHDSVHVDEHEHDGTTDDHDDHFCHCSVHAVAILSAFATPPMQKPSATTVRHDNRFSSRSGPPLLRPPIS